jgi:hypothetical protein
MGGRVQLLRVLLVMMVLQAIPAQSSVAQEAGSEPKTTEELGALDDPVECDRIGWMHYENQQISDEFNIISACQSPIVMMSTCIGTEDYGVLVEPSPGMMWVYCVVTVGNIGDKAVSLRGSAYELIDSKGVRYEEDQNILRAISYEEDNFGNIYKDSVYSADVLAGLIGFQIPERPSFPLRLEMNHPVFSSPSDPSIIIIEELNTTARYMAGLESYSEESTSTSSSSSRSTSSSESSTSASNGSLKIGSITTKDAGIGDGTIYVYVEVTNNTSKLYSYVGLDGTCYSASGSILGTGFGNTANVAPGETVVVTMIFLSVPGCDNVKVRFDSLTDLV